MSNGTTSDYSSSESTTVSATHARPGRIALSLSILAFVLMITTAALTATYEGSGLIGGRAAISGAITVAVLLAAFVLGVIAIVARRGTRSGIAAIVVSVAAYPLTAVLTAVMFTVLNGFGIYW